MPEKIDEELSAMEAASRMNYGPYFNFESHPDTKSNFNVTVIHCRAWTRC